MATMAVRGLNPLQSVCTLYEHERCILHLSPKSIHLKFQILVLLNSIIPTVFAVLHLGRSKWIWWVTTKIASTILVQSEGKIKKIQKTDFIFQCGNKCIGHSRKFWVGGKNIYILLKHQYIFLFR